MFRIRSYVFGILLVSLGALCVSSAGLAADIEIFIPKNEQTVHNNSGNVTVEIMALLEPGQSIRLLVDGQRAAPDSRDLTFNLEGIDRGEHTLQALILDERGYVVAKSQPVIFFMWQASSRFPPRLKPIPQGR